jgi:hypothetical protein
VLSINVMWVNVNTPFPIGVSPKRIVTIGR